MKGSSLDDLMVRLVKQRVASAAVAPEEAAVTVGPARSTFPPISSGAMPEVAVAFHVHFASAGPPAPMGVSARRLLGDAFSAAELEQLQAIEPTLLRWMASDKKNAARYFADPLGALKEAGVALEPKLLRKVRQQRSRSLSGLDSGARLPRARIVSIDVDAKR